MSLKTLICELKCVLLHFEQYLWIDNDAEKMSKIRKITFENVGLRN